jgi:hypothetical protein
MDYLEELAVQSLQTFLLLQVVAVAVVAAVVVAVAVLVVIEQTQHFF